jgi:20S proteasome alpha/beta subunit
MELTDAVELAVKAIREATYRDGYSGGYINVVHVNKSGAFHILRRDSREIKSP